MARDYASYLDRGARIVAIVIDKPSQNAAMVEKLALPFPILSDPDGEVMIKPFDIWDARGRMSKPATIVIAPDGSEVYRYVGVDLVDRPVHEEALEAVAGLALPPIAEPVETVRTVNAEAGQRALNTKELSLYMRGVRSSTNELSERLHDAWDREECARTFRMAERFIASLAETDRVVKRSRD
jgi:alkyl hydroperoxide reductase subunit AhpC